MNSACRAWSWTVLFLYLFFYRYGWSSNPRSKWRRNRSFIWHWRPLCIFLFWHHKLLTLMGIFKVRSQHFPIRERCSLIYKDWRNLMLWYPAVSFFLVVLFLSRLQVKPDLRWQRAMTHFLRFWQQLCALVILTVQIYELCGDLQGQTSKFWYD